MNIDRKNGILVVNPELDSTDKIQERDLIEKLRQERLNCLTDNITNSDSFLEKTHKTE